MSVSGSATTNHRFVALDAWRGIAACLVALFHFGSTSHVQNAAFLRNSWLFVDFFFVLSGFVIFAGYEEKLKRGFGFGRFLLLRFGRLYPLHLALLAAFVATDLLRLIPGLGGFSAYKPFTGPGETPAFIFSNLLLAQSMGIHNSLSFNDPSWSISVEFYTYIVFGLAIAILKERVRWVIVTLLLLAPVFLAIFSPHYMDTTFQYGFIRCLFGFSAGAVCWHLFKRHQAVAATFGNERVWSVIEIALLALIAGFIAAAKSSALTLAAPVVFSVTVLAFSMERGIVSRILKSRVFVLLGLWSYSIYMDHMFIKRKLFESGGLVLERLLHVHLFTTVGNDTLMGRSPWQGDAFAVLYLAVLIAVSYLTYRAIEEPGRDWFRSLALFQRRNSERSDRTDSGLDRVQAEAKIGI